MKATGLGIILLSVMVAMTVQAAQPGSGQRVQDLAYGVALYQLFQQHNLAAITEISAARQRQRLRHQKDDAELLLGGLYYDFGLPENSEKIFRKMLDEKKPVSMRNRVWFNLARVQYEKGRYARARQLLARIEGDLSPQWRAQQYYMLGNIEIKAKQFDQAQQALKQINPKFIWRDYSRYNLGVARLVNEQDRHWLESLLQRKTNDDELIALQDSARYILGLSALRNNDIYQALDDFSAIHADSPFSNRALLASGWAWYKKSFPANAIKFWRILQKRNQPDAATLESKIAVADSYEKMGDKSLAIATYRKAANDYERFLDDLNLVDKTIDQPSFIARLKRANHLAQAKKPVPADSNDSLLYLDDLLSRGDFQQALKNYGQLVEIRQALERWRNKIPLYTLMLKERKRLFETRRDQLDSANNERRLQRLKTRRDELAGRVRRIKNEQDFRALANEDEMDFLAQLQDIKKLADKLQPVRDVSKARERYRIMSGLLDYRLATEFPQRFWQLKRALQLLDRALVQATRSTQSLSRAAERNARNMIDFERRIAGQGNAISQQLQRTDRLLLQQQGYIENLAHQAIQKRRDHVLALRLSARYAIARLLDEIASEKQQHSEPSQ